MKNTYLFIVLVGSLGLFTTCQPDEKEAPATLCSCIESEEGKWDMSLSDDCIEACIEKFGPELKGMEDWFNQNCPKPKLTRPTERKQI